MGEKGKAEMTKKKYLVIVVIVNLLIFATVNLLFNIKYEQVDDFIIYNLYSGLDGTYNIHGVYIHPMICLILSLLFRIIPIINWHSIFLLGAQFICFTLIGYNILKKNDNMVSIVLYTIFASIFYTSLLMMIQYTSVAALLISTSLVLLIDMNEGQEKKSLKYKILIFTLFTIGLMTRMQSLIIVLPFMGIYFITKLFEFIKMQTLKKEFWKLVKDYIIYFVITLVVYGSSLIIYDSNDMYKTYMEYNDIRTFLQDITKVSYDNNKEIFDEIGWSKNDYYMFYTFNFGDENIYSKDNLEKIWNYKIQKDGKYNFNKNLKEVFDSFVSETMNTYTYISIFLICLFIINVLINKEKIAFNILIFAATIGLHIFFITMGRSMQRVVIPGYVIGDTLLIYNFKLDVKRKISNSIKNNVLVTIVTVIICFTIGTKYNYGYKLNNYTSIQKIINYTNQNKKNVYLYTVPSLQYRYLAYSVYQMPPKAAFSNLRVIGGWDMFTQNYYDFKDRYNLDGSLLDLLKENVYLIDGDVYWSGRLYENYKEHIILAIKEHYGIDAECELVEQFDNLKIYKLQDLQKRTDTN